MIDQELRQYLDSQIESIKALIASEIRRITDKLIDTLGPVRENVERLRTDVSDLYQKDRDQSGAIAGVRENLLERVGRAESRIGKLEEARDQKDRSSSKTITVLSVIIAGLGLMIGIVGFVL